MDVCWTPSWKISVILEQFVLEKPMPQVRFEAIMAKCHTSQLSDGELPKVIFTKRFRELLESIMNMRFLAVYFVKTILSC